MKTFVNVVIMLICILCMVTCIGFATHPPTTDGVVGCSACSDVALASDCPTPPIYNFNQYIVDDGYISEQGYKKIDGGLFINAIPEITKLIYENEIKLDISHKYYIGINQSSSYLCSYEVTSREGENYCYVGKELADIFTPKNSNGLRLYIRNYEKAKFVDVSIKPILIDLTQMFGVGNEPATLDDLYKVIPKGSYFPYTTGVPVGGNGLNMYNQGVQDTLKSFQVKYEYLDYYRKVQPINLNDYPTRLEKNDRSIILNGFALLPFNAVIPKGKTITIDIGYLMWNTSLSSLLSCNLEIGYIDDNYFRAFASYPLTAFEEYRDIKLYTSLPLDVDNVVVKCVPTDKDNIPSSEGYVAITDITISYEYYNPKIQLDTAYDSGYNAGNTDGYNKGYGDGSRDGSEVSGFGWLRNIFASIGTIFDIKVFGNVTIGTFFAVPLILGVVMFIIHIARG